MDCPTWVDEVCVCFMIDCTHTLWLLGVQDAGPGLELGSPQTQLYKLKAVQSEFFKHFPVDARFRNLCSSPGDLICQVQPDRNVAVSSGPWGEMCLLLKLYTCSSLVCNLKLGVNIFLEKLIVIIWMAFCFL